MRKLLDKARNLRHRRDDGASAVEYGLLVALIAVVIAAAVVTLGSSLQDKFSNACAAVANKAAGAPADANCSK